MTKSFPYFFNNSTKASTTNEGSGLGNELIDFVNRFFKKEL